MLTFVLTTAGILLVLYGDKLFEPAVGSDVRTRASTGEIANGWWSRSSPKGASTIRSTLLP
ncbi:hypothetical protein EQZ23_06625 [Sphingomonas sp. UV9]|uniref:hypothetical protein n=1 Tax=Sphingomonas sp. UV9 TaxID=1851410 RepID=UPI000FFC11A1|nr:hypothetical protein [Sphingomonas sp. UV9]RXD04818.1 hypothetical protein EQZ23_06625 [Sphingomonas sp. UV9]